MSVSHTNLEQILELLLAEDTEKAEELLHEYVVGKARAEYERVLDEAEEVGEDIYRGSKSKDFEEEILDDEEEIHRDTVEAEEDDEEPVELGDFDNMEEPEMDDMAEPEMDDMDDMGDMDMDDDADDDIEDKVEDMEADLEDLRRELESLIAAQGDDAGEMDMTQDVDADGPNRFVPMDMDADDDMEDEMMDSVEYDLDEMEDLEEASKLQDKVAEPKSGAGDAEGASPFSKAPKHSRVSSQGKPVHAKDGAEGKRDHGSKTKTQNPTDRNIKVDHKKGPAIKDGKANQDGSNKASPFSKSPK